MGDASCCERESGMAESGGAYEPSRAATVVAETEPFFRDVMEVYIDLLCRGERDASRLLFRSGVRFAAAVHGMHRAAGRPAAMNPADAARRHLERCLFALWSARRREPQEREEQQRGEQQPPVDTAALFERGLAMLSALRGLSAAEKPAADDSTTGGSNRRPAISPLPRERPGHEELHTWIRERTSSPPNR